MIDFSSLQGLEIPEGSVSKITDSTGAVLWQKAEDKYTWDAVLASIAAGTYATDYAVGDCVPLDLGSEGIVNMQIAGFDVDDKADGTGKAPVSWISKELLATSHRMNPNLVENDDGTREAGTGAIDGWNRSEMRAYLISTIYPLIPDHVKSAIVTVTKTQKAYDTFGFAFTQTTEDDLWIPSKNEIVGSSSTYYGLFQDTNANRIKWKVGRNKAFAWFMRSSIYDNQFDTVGDDGSITYYNANNTLSVALGFCT